MDRCAFLLVGLTGCLYDLGDLQGASDGASDVASDTNGDARDAGDAISDAASSIDGPAAISFSAGCGSLSAQSSLGLSFSNEDFTIAFWMRLDQAPAANDELGIVWRGGRTNQEPGWSVDLHGGALTFCMSDQSSPRCTPDWPVPLGHRIHVGVTAKWGDQNPRNDDIYVLDADTSSTTHTKVATAGGVNNWTSAAVFAIGAASPNGCSSFAPLIIDELRIHHAILAVAELDLMANSSPACNGTKLVFGWHFDEGVGALASACVGGEALALTGAYQWIPTPFP